LTPNPPLSSASPPECGRVACGDHQGEEPAIIPSPPEGEGKGEGDHKILLIPDYFTSKPSLIFENAQK